MYSIDGFLQQVPLWYLNFYLSCDSFLSMRVLLQQHTGWQLYIDTKSHIQRAAQYKHIPLTLIGVSALLKDSTVDIYSVMLREM